MQPVVWEYSRFDFQEKLDNFETSWLFQTKEFLMEENQSKIILFKVFHNENIAKWHLDTRIDIIVFKINEFDGPNFMQKSFSEQSHTSKLRYEKLIAKPDIRIFFYHYQNIH